MTQQFTPPVLPAALTSLRAIPTAYKGYHFRSRLEARWAVFFDALGLRWEYEPEGFELGAAGRYLPDFRVTSPQGLVSWYEIKPFGHGPCEKLSALRKLFQLAAMTHTESGTSHDCSNAMNPSTMTLCGEPADVLQGRTHVCPRCGGITDDDLYADSDVMLACGACDMNTPGGGGHPVEHGVLAPYRPHKGWVMCNRGDWDMAIQRVKRAINAARSARFEFGESGATL